MTDRTRTRISSINVHPTPSALSRPAGLKGRMLSLVLSTPVVVLSGPNGAGKTTAGPLAFAAAMVGLAERPNDESRPWVDGLCQATTVTVSLTDGAAWSRDLSMGPREKGSTEATAQARALVGPAPVLDFGALLTAAPKDRRAAMVQLARAAAATAPWTVADARAAVLTAHAGHMPEEGLAGAFWSALAAPVLAFDGSTAEEWLVAAEERAVKAQTAANASKRQADAVVQDRSKAHAKLAAIPETDADDAARLDALRTERAALLPSPAAVQQATSAVQRHTAEGQRLSAAVQTAAAQGKAHRERGITDGLVTYDGATPQPVPYTGAVSPDVLAEVAAAHAALDAPIPALPGPDMAALREEVRRAEEAVRIATEAAAAAHASEQQAAAAVAVADDAVSASAAAEAHALAALAAATEAHRLAFAASREADTASAQDSAALALAEHGTVPTCRHCGAADPLGDAPDLDLLRERDAKAQQVAADALAALHDARIAVDGAQHDHADAVATHRAARETADDARAALSAAARDAADAEASTDRARRNLAHACAALAAAEAAPDPKGRKAQVMAERRARIERAEAAVQREEDRITRERAAHAAAVTRWMVERDRLAEVYSAARSALDEWSAVPAPTVPQPGDVSAIFAEVQAITSRQKARAAYAESAAGVQRAIDAALHAEVQAQSARALVKAIGAAWVELSAPAVPLVHDAARRLAQGVESAGLPRPYFAGLDDAGNIDAGIERDGQRVPLSAASGSERLVASALLLAGLVITQRSPVPVLVLDELDRIAEHDQRDALIRAIAMAASDGLIATAIITEAHPDGAESSPADRYAAIQGVTVIDPRTVATLTTQQ